MCGHGIVMQTYCTFSVFALGFGHVSWLNASQPILMTNGRGGSWKNKNLGKLRPSGWLNGHRDLILGNDFESMGWLVASKNTWANFDRPIAGVSCPRAERRPQRATTTRPCGATWPMECTSSAVSMMTAELTGSMTSTFMTARRREDGIWLSCRYLCKNSSAIAWQVWWGLMI